MVSPQPEKRTAPRKAVKVPAKVHTESGDIPAEAINLSKSGIFLECATRVSEGSPVDIVMILPKEVTGDAAKWVCCHATVRRVENHMGDTGRYGVAATVDRMQAMPELSWPQVDRRITERRGAERRKSARAEGQDRRRGDRRNSI
jgi:PilZ domain-containing protein